MSHVDLHNLRLRLSVTWNETTYQTKNPVVVLGVVFVCLIGLAATVTVVMAVMTLIWAVLVIGAVVVTGVGLLTVSHQAAELGRRWRDRVRPLSQGQPPSRSSRPQGTVRRARSTARPDRAT
jgi:protein-S-isoprenylcysteine O-methyltransferase Ste14